MATTLPAEKIFSSKLGPKLDKKPSGIGIAIFFLLLLVGLGYVGTELVGDLARAPHSALFPYILLGIALLIALAFEFVNGFHDTANAVATVIYTHSLEPNTAVMWSGTWNFIGVLVSSGAVAFGIVSLLPVELILQVGNGAGFAMGGSRFLPRPSSGISGRGGSVCLLPAPTLSSDRFWESGSQTS